MTQIADKKSDNPFDIILRLPTPPGPIAVAEWLLDQLEGTRK